MTVLSEPSSEARVREAARSTDEVAECTIARVSFQSLLRDVDQQDADRESKQRAADTAGSQATHPWPFSGGTIKRLIIDLSGEAYVDLEMEALAAMKRD